MTNLAGKQPPKKLVKVLVYTELTLAALLLGVLIAMVIVASTWGALSPYTRYTVEALKYVAGTTAVMAVILDISLKIDRGSQSESAHAMTDGDNSRPPPPIRRALFLVIGLACFVFGVQMIQARILERPEIDYFGILAGLLVVGAGLQCMASAIWPRWWGRKSN